ncbi:MAG: cupin domain-containing protein [Acidobacteria bacterium]|nr:cupin domain-containing protein [Acidobacteriota bacterium]
MTRRACGWTALPAVMMMLLAAPAWAQAVAGPEKARPVQGDPGISSMVVLDLPQFRVLRDYAEPGATRRMHAHKDATYHVFVLITGQLRLTVNGEAPVVVNPGEALSLAGGVEHTFVNIGPVTSTIVEVFGKGSAAPGDVHAWAALARAPAIDGSMPRR